MQLVDLLSQKRLVLEHSPVEIILDRVKKREDSSTPLTILYGETFDEKGHAIDSLKYYFFVSMLSKLLSKISRANIRPSILIADLGVYRNYPDEAEKLRKVAEERKQFAEKIKKVYNCFYEVSLMRDIASTSDFEQRLQKVKAVTRANPLILELIERSVPEDRLQMERKRGYIYSFEEVATILGLDIKIGPPRERLYDSIVNTNVFLRKFNVDPLLSIYLYPTYPLGLQYGTYLSSRPIQEFGLTPYKVGSGDMTANRIALGKTSSEKIRTLIENTQISQSPKKPNPVLDLAVIAELARQHLENNFRDITIADKFYSQQLSIRDLKSTTFKNVEEYILRYFK